MCSASCQPRVTGLPVLGGSIACNEPLIPLFSPCLPIQVYNEVIHDLLLPSRQLTLREDSQKGVVVSGLSQHQVRTHTHTRHVTSERQCYFVLFTHQ